MKLEIQIECTYCGNKWNATSWSKTEIDSMICPKCKDSRLIVRDRTSKVDYYQGSPPFPPKKQDDFPWGMHYLGEMSHGQGYVYSLQRLEDRKVN